MDTNTYEVLAATTDIYTEDTRVMAYALGIASEAGEVAGKVKKMLRGDPPSSSTREAILSELGDVLWYMTRMGSLFDYTLSDIMEANIAKLRGRYERNTIMGSGDVR